MQILGVEGGVQNMHWGVGCGFLELGLRMQIPAGCGSLGCGMRILGAGVQDVDLWNAGSGSWLLGLECGTWPLGAG